MPIIADHFEQGTPEWFQARIGCITMSHAQELICNGRKGETYGKSRETYLVSVASEIVTGVPAEEYKSWKMLRGNILEQYARRAYEVATGIKTETVGLGYLDSKKRISASPDFLEKERRRLGGEIKCRAPKEHLATILAGHNPAKDEAQIQGNIWVFDVDAWDYCSFCPEFKSNPLFIDRVERNEEMIERIKESAFLAVREVDEMVQAVKGDPSKTVLAICQDALEELEAAKAIDAEIY